MKNLRKYGDIPYRATVIHGGPGAPGEMAPVARELASIIGVLEPLQTRDSIDRQVAELHKVLKENAELPVVLIGHSWGAWLSYIFASRHPSLIRKLILVGTPPFPVENALDIMTTRLERLSEGERAEFFNLVEALNNPGASDKNRVMARFGQLTNRADTYEALPHDDELIEYRFDINQSVWAEANMLRSRGELLALGKGITCPVVAIHGDYDPHPAAGVRAPLSSVLRDFTFILLEKCGHEPWIERYARDQFYKILRREIV
jgi:pimeloyl-ACP methyl ester carboxylesterase